MGGMCSTGHERLADPKYDVKYTRLPLWVQQAGRGIFQEASDLAQSPFPTYQGPSIASYGDSKLTPEEQKAHGILMDQASSYQPYIGTSYGAAKQLGQGYDQMTRGELLGPGYQGAARGSLVGGPRDSQSRGDLIGESADIGKFSLADAEPYMDIYQQAADPAIEAIRRQAAAQQSQLSAQAAGAGAFGGSRQAVQSAMLGAEGARAAGDLRARAAQEGLGFAAGRFDVDRQARMAQAEQDRAARFRAEDVMEGRREADRAARFRAEDVLSGRHTKALEERFGAEAAAREGFTTQEAAKLRRAQELAGYAPLVQGLQEQAASGMMTAGAARRKLDQMSLDLAKADWTEQRQYPMEMLNFALGALRQVPYETRNIGLSQGQKYIETPSIYGQTLGGLGSLASAYWMSRPK